MALHWHDSVSSRLTQIEDCGTIGCQTLTKQLMEFSLAALLLAVNAVAQPTAASGGWANVRQLAPGTGIRLALTGGRTLRGSVQTVTPDSLTINANQSQEMLPRGEIRRVESKRNGHRGRNTLIGLAIGAGGGLGVGAAVDSGDHGWFPNLGKAILTPAGAIIGAIVGVAIPSGGWHEIYRAP